MYDFVNEAAAITKRDRSNLIQHQSGGKSKTGTTKPKLISTWLTLNMRKHGLQTDRKNGHHPTI